MNNTIPKIKESTKEERAEYIAVQYACKSDCDNCGICKVLKGKSPETAFADYIEGKCELFEIKV